MSDDFARGVKEGQDDATLANHTAQLARINGLIERTAKALERLAGEIRSMQEEMRSAALEVVVAAKTLATETERRRLALVNTDRRFSKRERIAAICVTALTALAGLYIHRH